MSRRDWCFIFHRWSRWSKSAEGIATNKVTGAEHDCFLQFRTCQRCGKEQLRKVTTP